MIKFRCPHCKQKLGVPDEYASRRVRCSKCSQPLTVPAQQPAPAEQPAKSPPPQTAKEASPKPQLKFRCPSCSQKLAVPIEYAGRRVRCSKCNQPATVPAAQPQPVPQPPAPDVLTTQDAFAPSMWDDLQLQESDPDPVSVNPNLEPGSDQSQFKAENDFTMTNLAEIPLRRRVALVKPKKNILKSVLCMVAIIAILIAGIRFVLGGSNDSIPPEIENFAEDFIIMLTDNNIDTVKEFLSPQNTASDAQINELLQSMADVEILGITSRCRYGIVNEEASGYLYSCAVETDQAGRTFTLSILDESETIALVNATVIDETGREIIMLGDNNPLAIMTQLNKIVDGGTEIAVSGPLQMVARASILLLIIQIITVLSIWALLAEAGELTWIVAIIPPYTLYLLARVANRPGWFGVIAALGQFIPVVGGLVSVAMFMIISIGVAREYGKGILFGIGLGLLPFIFYPLLVITKSAFD